VCIDICSTCCSCVFFVTGRLFELRLLDASNIITIRMSLFMLPVVFSLGFIGLNPSYAVPFLGEILYPGVCGMMPLLVPLLKWSRHKQKWLIIALLVFGLAFLTAVFESVLCVHVGPHWTTPTVCFAMCDVLFIILANLLDVWLW
jgi:hypothetical protein